MRLGRTILAILASATFAAACQGSDRALSGKYEYVGSADKATLSINKDGTYRLCIPSMPCEVSKYDFESWPNGGDRVFFHGEGMIKFTAGGWVNVDYGGRCPCLLFQDPDSGVQFEKVSG